MNCLLHALESSELILESIVYKHNFLAKHSSNMKNERQKKVVNRFLDGFEGKLTTSKWAKISKCSQDTAARDINDLIEKKILHRLPGGGRSTGYDINREI